MLFLFCLMRLNFTVQCSFTKLQITKFILHDAWQNIICHPEVKTIFVIVMWRQFQSLYSINKMLLLSCISLILCTIQSAKNHPREEWVTQINSKIIGSDWRSVIIVTQFFKRFLFSDSKILMFWISIRHIYMAKWIYPESDMMQIHCQSHQLPIIFFLKLHKSNTTSQRQLTIKKILIWEKLTLETD